MSDSRLDIERQKYEEWMDGVRSARQDACKDCSEHNESCPYYDAEEESWDYDECFRDRGY